MNFSQFTGQEELGPGPRRWIRNSQAQRSIVRNSLGALFGLSQFPLEGSGIEQISHGAFGFVGKTIGLTAIGATHGGGGAIRMMGAGAFHMANDYRKWRKGAAKDLRARYLEDGGHSFFSRTAGGHVKRAAKNFVNYTLLSPMAMGMHLAFAGMSSNDNLMDVHNGFATSLASSVASEVGFIGGGALGSALAAVALPGVGLAAAAGFLYGGFKGGELGTQAIEGLVGMAEYGMRNGRHAKPFRVGFQDSEHAATMRQRAVNSIYRSQMNARSAFGNEALAYHG